MIQRSDLPETVPVFPLPGALLLPRAHLPLHIFEPRYLQMFDDALKTDERLIGMIQPLQDDRLHTIGCVGRITGFTETEDGRYMVSLLGHSRFRVEEEVDGFQPYRRCRVNWDGFERDQSSEEEKDFALNRDSLLELLNRFFSDKGISTDWDALKDAEDELLINSLSMLCPFEPEDKQALLEAPRLNTRRETLVTLIEYALRGGTADDVMQ